MAININFNALVEHGVIAKKVIDRYEKGFDKPAPKTEIYTLNIGK